MESVAKIRHMYYVKGLKIKQIAKKLNIARNTVRRVLKTKDPQLVYKRDKETNHKLGPYIKDLEQLLEESKLEPAKRRYTAKRLHEILKERGYLGAYDSVQRHVKEWWEKGATHL